MKYLAEQRSPWCCSFSSQTLSPRRSCQLSIPREAQRIVKSIRSEEVPLKWESHQSSAVCREQGEELCSNNSSPHYKCQTRFPAPSKSLLVYRS